MKAIALVTVCGGVAEAFAPEHVDCQIVDVDNIKAGDQKTVLPANIGFEELAAEAGVLDYVTFSDEKGGGS